MVLPVVRLAPLASVPLDIEALFQHHAPTVARWARRLGGPLADADDVVQEVFLVARRRLHRFDNTGQLTTWLFRTTERVVFAARRKARLRRWLSRTPPDLAPAVPQARPTPLEAVERHEIAVAMYALLDRLPERWRRVLILFEMEGLELREIAALTGTPAATVKVWLHRARHRLTALYAAHEAARGSARPTKATKGERA